MTNQEREALKQLATEAEPTWDKNHWEPGHEQEAFDADDKSSAFREKATPAVVQELLAELETANQEREAEAESRREAYRERQDARDKVRWANAEIARLEALLSEMQARLDLKALRAEVDALPDKDDPPTREELREAVVEAAVDFRQAGTWRWTDTAVALEKAVDAWLQAQNASQGQQEGKE